MNFNYYLGIEISPKALNAILQSKDNSIDIKTSVAYNDEGLNELANWLSENSIPLNEIAVGATGPCSYDLQEWLENKHISHSVPAQSQVRSALGVSDQVVLDAEQMVKYAALKAKEWNSL
jgi:hypothetical protein